MVRWFPLLLLLFVAPWPAAAAPVVLVVGDSLGTAFGLEPREGWVAQLGERLADRGFPHRVVNASISGDTTQGGVARLPRALRVHEPDTVVIELGGNDGLRGYPIERMRANLESMITMSRDAGANVLLVGVTIPPNYGPDYRRRFTRAYETLADKHGVPLVVFAIEEVAERDGMLQADGVHPTAAAQGWMLDIVWSQLEGLVTAR
ncbi:MAG: arylesterase [Gammaproteobacteria bacterium]